MKNKLIAESIISLVLIGLLAFYINPLDLLMPQQMEPLMLPVLLILSVLFGALLWGEKPVDEREIFHTFIASRVAYFAGIVTLLVGIIVQSLHHVIDPWLVITVCVLLLAKLLGHVIGYIRH